MEQTSITPKLLLPGADVLPAERLRELTNEEATLRHRIELRVEQALYRVAVGLTQLGNGESYDTTSPRLARMWGDEQNVEFAISEAKMVLRELQSRQLYRSTHHCFSQYLRERFGWCKSEIYPEAAISSMNALHKQ